MDLVIGSKKWLNDMPYMVNFSMSRQDTEALKTVMFIWSLTVSHIDFIRKTHLKLKGHYWKKCFTMFFIYYCMYLNILCIYIYICDYICMYMWQCMLLAYVFHFWFGAPWHWRQFALVVSIMFFYSPCCELVLTSILFAHNPRKYPEKSMESKLVPRS